MRATIPETPLTKAVVAGLCGYEVAAIASRGRVPTITALSRRWPVVGAVIVTALAVHFTTPEDR
jgi:hypothetical protein